MTGVAESKNEFGEFYAAFKPSLCAARCGAEIVPSPIRFQGISPSFASKKGR
jgi:hypothetical protein